MLGELFFWGPSDDIELYLQETGRAGRDMQPSQSILYYGGPNLIVRHREETMKMYFLNNEVCRHQFLLKQFDATCSLLTPICCCCDLCELKSKSDKCLNDFN